MERHILVVDDEPVLADTLAMIFRQAGYASTCAYTAESAFDAIQAHCPSLIVSDVVMPGMNGIEFARNVRTQWPSCQILLFSGNADTQGLLESARKEGEVPEVLAKPVPPPRMLAKVASLLA